MVGTTSRSAWGSRIFWVSPFDGTPPDWLRFEGDLFTIQPTGSDWLAKILGWMETQVTCTPSWILLKAPTPTAPSHKRI
eukprot:scaffold6130_cov112-Isochrysis_galbana.AAC.4